MWTDDSILHLVWFSVFIFRGIEFFLLKCPHPPLLDHHALPRTSLACSIKSQFRKKLYLQKLVLFRNNRLLLYVISYFQKYSKVFKHFARGHYIKYKPRSYFRWVACHLFSQQTLFQLTDWWKNSEIDTSRPVLGELSISDFDNFFSESI